MYKLVSVFLAFSLTISAADVKTVKQVINVEVKKAKSSYSEDISIETSNSVSMIKQEASTKKIKKHKKNELSTQKKEALYNRLDEEKRLLTKSQTNKNTGYVDTQKSIESYDKSLLMRKLETGIQEQSLRSPAYIQGTKKS